ncbi:MAG TPA: molybdopterin cofactor-binding domain-containing protein [Rhizomicrobium sp.]|jgi:isoquinoline 1-oxidoreductase beta subunit
MNANPDRRVFILASAAVGAGLVLGVSGCGPTARRTAAGALNMWLSVASDGTTTIRVNATDIGQGAQTGLAQIVADEMDADWSKVHVEMAPVSDATMVKRGGYYTGGSSSIRGGQFELFAQAGATARAMLIAAAAKRWRVDATSCLTSDGAVHHPPSGRAFFYGDLAREAAALPMPAGVKLKSRAERRLIGKPVARLDIPEKVDGRAIYGIDVKLPGMLVGTVVQCPFFGGTLAGVDERPALAIRGVEHVVKLGNSVVVAAQNFPAATKGLAALSPRWTRPRNPIASDDAMFAELARNIGASDSTIVASDTNDAAGTVRRVGAALADANRVFEARYRVPFLSHSPIEPMNATAQLTDGGCELWAPMQNQGRMRDDVAKALRCSKESVTLHTTQVGGGFGRRLETDYGVMAALAAKAIGKPIKLIWSREEDMSHDFYRPASSCIIRAALDSGAMIRAIDYSGATANDTAIGGFIGNYPIPDVVVRQKQTAFPITVGAWRSVDPSITVFFLESLVDEIAHDAGIDPVAYRRRLLVGDARGLRTLDACAEMADWGRAPAGRFRGVAYFCYRHWGTSVCEIVELSVDESRKVTFHKVFCAIDPGTAINPDAVEAQAMGGIIMGLSAAFGEAITLKDGRVAQTNFDRYPILRLANTPEIQVRVLETPDAPIGGCGEPPVPPAAPALANAIFAATGTRVRALPIANAGFTI